MSTSAAAVKPKKPRKVTISRRMVSGYKTAEDRINYVLPKVFGRKTYTLTPENRWIHDRLTYWEELPEYMQKAYFGELNDYIRSSSDYTRYLNPYETIPRDDFAKCRRELKKHYATK
jgi:hypothetical protein